MHDSCSSLDDFIKDIDQRPTGISGEREKRSLKMESKITESNVFKYLGFSDEEAGHWLVKGLNCWFCEDFPSVKSRGPAKFTRTDEAINEQVCKILI